WVRWRGFFDQYAHAREGCDQAVLQQQEGPQTWRAVGPFTASPGCPVRSLKERYPIGLARSFLMGPDGLRVVMRWLSLKQSRHEERPRQDRRRGQVGRCP